MKTSFLFLVLMLFGNLLYSQNSPSDEYIKGNIIVKVKSTYSEKCQKSSIAIPTLQNFIRENQIQSTTKIFPNHSTIKKVKSNHKKVDLSTIYRFKFDERINPQKLINQLKKEKSIAYAELEYINQIAYTPTDSLNSEQWYLSAIRAFQAWDVEKGDTNVVIGIVDTGADIDHEDLQDDLSINYDDPINGVDDDNDGYIDNYYGWNTAENSNDVNPVTFGHGSNVAGIASASTDNGLGISGCGFNSRLLIVRADNDAGALIGAYEGIVYAADHGAFIINNSWGSFTYSQLAQDIVNYAAINKGALVVCAAGNGRFTGPNAGIGIEAPFYPAAYDNVISVGSLIEGDTVKASSNYGHWLDVFAPGELLFTTNAANGYGTNGGTSMAAPVVAGVAALIKSHFPSYTAKQVKERLIATADNIDAINETKYHGKIGSGRINAFRALTDQTTPGIDFINRIISDNNNEIFGVGDTIRISGDFKNYLSAATNVTASIRSLNQNLTLLNGNATLGNINALDSSSNRENPFLFLINSNTGYNETAELELSISSNNNSYQRKIIFPLTINPDYITVNENDLTVTLTSNGSIGYSGTSNELGEGIRFRNGNSLLFEGSFIVGNDSNYIPNRFRGESNPSDDFEITEIIQPITNESVDFQSQAGFNDGGVSSSPLLEITQSNYISKRSEVAQSVIYVFNIKNNSSNRLINLHAGLLLDWDINNYSKNKVKYDAQRKMGIAYATDSNLFCGVKVLNDELNSFHYGIDNTQNGNSGVHILDGFSNAEKFKVISSNRHLAGETGPDGNDVLDVNSIGPFDLEADSNQLISFAVIIADSEAELNLQADSIDAFFKRINLNLIDLPKEITQDRISVYPNPANEQITIDFNIAKSENLTIQVFDVQGKLIYQENNSYFSKGRQLIQLKTNSWKTGLYLLEISGNQLQLRNNFVVSH